MTGFGSAEGVVGGSRVSVEVRSVNHRFFNPSVKLPSRYSRWEAEVRESLRKHVSRGHVTVAAYVERAATEGSAVDEVKFAQHAAALRSLRDRHGLEGAVDVATVLRMPDVIRTAAEDVAEGSAEELVSIVEAAASALTRMREAEGGRLAEVLLERMVVVEAALTRVAARAPERVIEQRDRLRENVKVLAEGVALDEQRVAQEIAILADRLDVSEEIDRFGAHVEAFREVIGRKGAEPAGKRLGFILQEMLREANTTGSKANDTLIQREVLLVKEELERIREQVENVE
jgi:uncharacterized protein (TIGR00255 family)